MGVPELRTALAARHPWVLDPDVGPQTIEAGECDGCGAEARMVQTCGPGAALALGRRCAAARGVDAWCGGHREEAVAALARLADLPAEADLVARLWWVATGEVRVDPALLAEARRLGLAASQ